MFKDIEIAQNSKIEPIIKIADKIGIEENEIELYGKYKAKVNEDFFLRTYNRKNGKLILVTAVNPTPAGEGKTTVSVGLGDALNAIGKKTVIALREPSLGPVFGVKGGATGGGYSQVVPMEDINLHFTGDIHAVTTANNLLCAMVDNHIFQGNNLNIDQRRILVKRCIDMNDRELRQIVGGLGAKVNGIPREDNFVISVASEVMAILCLAKDIDDLKFKLGNILIGYTFENKPIFAKQLKANGAMAAVLKDAMKPNLVQTLEHTPTLIHGGPFANIAHGCNSIRATKLALKLADYCVTEAGFGSDLGAEKFLDIKCTKAGLSPNAIVLVATVRALKYNGGKEKFDLTTEDINALKRGIVNLDVHIDNLSQYNVPLVVCINKFYTDTNEEINFIKNFCRSKSVDCCVSDMFLNGSSGGTELANTVVKLCSKENNFKPLYNAKENNIVEKIDIIAKNIYHAKDVVFSKKALKSLDEIKTLNAEDLPVCIAKTQYSLTDSPNLLGKPKDFTVTVKDISVSNGAGFVVVYMGDIMTMPGLPKIPAAENIDISINGKIEGLF